MLVFASVASFLRHRCSTKFQTKSDVPLPIYGACVNSTLDGNALDTAYFKLSKSPLTTAA